MEDQIDHEWLRNYDESIDLAKELKRMLCNLDEYLANGEISREDIEETLKETAEIVKFLESGKHNLLKRAQWILDQYREWVRDRNN